MEEHINPKEVVERFNVDELCRSAENYFHTIASSLPNPYPLTGKPFADIFTAPDVCYKLGLVLAGLKLGRTMKVLDFGAGTCWLSRYLNQLGCSTISIEPSETALELGRQMFRDFPIMGDYIEEPIFLKFDGHKIDVPNGFVDRVVCFDVFHHIPNQESVLREIFRVLKPGGIAGFSEPGRIHSRQPHSQSEMRNYGVLENDIFLEEIWEVARAAGFSEIRITPLCTKEPILNIQDYIKIINEKVIPEGVGDIVADNLIGAAVFFFQKGKLMYDSRMPVGLRCEVSISRREFRVRAGVPLKMDLLLKNTGEARWLASNIKDIGKVRIGTHLYDQQSNLLDFNFYRCDLGGDVEPGQKVKKTISPVFSKPGLYKLSIDMVSEFVAWFETLGGKSLNIRISVD